MEATRIHQIATAALLEAGHPELLHYLHTHPTYGATITSPCPTPGIIIRAVALAHQALGHHVTTHHEQGHACFDCTDCGLTGHHPDTPVPGGGTP